MQPSASPARTKLAVRVWLGVLALSGLCVSAAMPERGTARALPRESGCSLGTKKPFYVAFAPGMTLDAFETAAVAAHDILRELKAQLCAPAASNRPPKHVSPSLYGALSARVPVQSCELGFEERSLERAHVNLARVHPDREGDATWRAHLVRRNAVWSLTRVTDEAAPERARQARQ